MKYILLVPDGAADLPCDELDGKTPLEAAKTPHLDRLAETGRVGAVQVTPPEMYPGSDAANMALLGYDPRKYYTGRGPIEAAAMDIPLNEKDVAFRCSIISTDGTNLLDYSAGHITTEEARPIIALANDKLATRAMRLFPGVSYRHILRWTDGPKVAALNHVKRPAAIERQGVFRHASFDAERRVVAALFAGGPVFPPIQTRPPQLHAVDADVPQPRSEVGEHPRAVGLPVRRDRRHHEKARHS